RRRQRRAPLPGGLYNPVAIERKRCNAGQATAAAAAVWPGRPTDDTDDHRLALLILEHRAARISRACAETSSRALAGRIDETDLQRAGLTGCDEIGGANRPSALSIAANSYADAGDGESIAGRKRSR